MAERPAITLAQVRAKLPPGAELAEVAIEDAVWGTFTYLADERVKGRLTPGARVRVPFGRRESAGYYLGPRTPEDLVGERLDPGRLKAILRRLDTEDTAEAPGEPLLTPELLALARWIARRYATPLGGVLSAMLPAGVKRGVSLAPVRWVAALKGMEELRAAAEGLKTRAPKQAALLHALVAAGGAGLASALLAEAEAASTALRTLERQGLLAVSEQTPVSLGEAYGPDPNAIAGRPELTPAQREACAALEVPLRAGTHQAFLLQGVTGSGKTEVYLRALELALNLGRRGIVLVPEIALTPQTAQRFEARLGRERVVVLHSHLSDGERAAAWRAARAGRVGVVVGARSALFAPLPGLGCIVVDEEHEGAFKQESAPRYHARAAALERARQAGAVLVLGSATPSLESFQAARAGLLTRLLLPERVSGAELPAVQIVDMRQENRETNRYNYLSRALAHALGATLERKEQAILFLNRRGFATVLTCVRCGNTERCARCDITLTSHRASGTAACHYCGFSKPAPTTCPECGAPGLKFWGVGTERVEEEVRRILPAARVARMDSDTMTRRGAYLETLSAFRAGRIEVLVGTQMIAKGLDFPNVTLVGIVLADTALHMPDFRARERTFQLLEQVAGRAGRAAKLGRVIVQSFLPADRSIQAAARHDYEGFCAEELRERQAYFYPPFSVLARVLLRGKDRTKLQAAGQSAAACLREAARGQPSGKAAILGPSPPPIAMLEGLHRLHVLVKAADAETLSRLFEGEARAALDHISGADVTVDVDPLAML